MHLLSGFSSEGTLEHSIGAALPGPQVTLKELTPITATKFTELAAIFNTFRFI